MLKSARNLGFSATARCETREAVFVNVVECVHAVQNPCCHTKHRNFPSCLLLPFVACVFPLL